MESICRTAKTRRLVRYDEILINMRKHFPYEVKNQSVLAKILPKQ